jgi:Ca2+-binding RTX toxin-like protein
MTLSISFSEPAHDTLTINTLGGADQVGASPLANSSILLTINGGDADDSLVGSQGNDMINGDAGDDLIRGPGDDILDGGSGTDFIDEGAGTDTAANGETVINVP